MAETVTPEEGPDGATGSAGEGASASTEAVGSASSDAIAEMLTPDEAFRPERRQLSVKKLLRRATAGLLLVLLAAVVGLSQTGEGQGLVLNAALDRVRSALAGELTVGGIRSGTLLTGATLTELRLDAADGRQFLVADSVVVRYSIPSFLAGGPPIRSTTFWGVDVEISQYSADDVLNLTRILAESQPDGTAAPADGPLDLGRIGVRDGLLTLLTPAGRGSEGPIVTRPDGTRLREIRFEDLDFDVEDALLRPGGAVSFEAGLASFSASVFILDEPLVLREIFGDVSFGVRGIAVDNAAFRLPSTLVRGAVVFGPERPDDGWTLRTEVRSDGWGDLADIRWIDARIPDGRFRGLASVRMRDAVEVDFDDFEVELEASKLLANGGASFSDDIALRGMEMTFSPLAVSRLEPWFGVEFPLEGWLSGQATFGGTLTDVAATGRLTLVPTGYGGGATTASFNGTVHRGSDPGATDLELRLQPLNYTVMESLWPGAPLAGIGEATLEVNGRAAGGIAIVADFEHLADSASTSRASARGLLRLDDTGQWVTDFRGRLDPLSVGALAALAPDAGLTGSLAGPIRVVGPLNELTVSGDLVAGDGGVLLTAALDLSDPSSGYEIVADAEALSLSALSTAVPERSTWSGHLELQGAGAGLDSLQASATVYAGVSRVGALRIDTVAATMRMQRGVLITDTLEATVGGIDVQGRGRFGLAPGAWGFSRFQFEAETLSGLRSMVMGVGDSVLVSDNLRDLDRQFLRASGIEPDTLPTAADVRMEGAVQGGLSLSGGLRSFDIGLIVDVTNGAYRHNRVDSAQIAFTATDLPATRGSWEVGASARGVVWQERTFQQGGFEAVMSDQVGVGRIELVRASDEQYSAAGSFRFEDGVGEIGLTDGQIQVGRDFYNLTGPARLAWDQTSLTVDSLGVEREGADPMSLTADGVLTRGGASDFRLSVDGFHLDRIMHIGQFDGVEIGGHVDVDLTVLGPAESPRINGLFRVDGPRYGTMELTRIDGYLDYADQAAAFSLVGWDGVRDAIDASGTLALDLSLTTVADRVLSRPMDIDISADSLDAAIALSYLSNLEEVLGVVSGQVHIGGTPDEPEPEGLITLADAEWSIEAIGVRHTAVGGSLTLNPDRTVDVVLTSTGPGFSEVSGTVTLVPFRDPALDLRFAFDRFQAVQRADVEGLISGEVELRGTYRRPVATGALTVDEGTVFVDEFRRVAGVVDLTDPFLFDFDQGFGVDTTALVAQPLVVGLRNPFFDNLRVDVSLAVPRDTWLRSVETNVEMGGDLLVAYDRSAADLVLIGELEAMRGSHLVLGRNFELDGGTVSFIGRPGLNPDLDIQASAQIRRRDGDLEVMANVGGTLVQPVVTLSTDEVGVGQADLVSYLIFGQANAELGSGQSAISQATTSGALSTLRDGGLTYVSGALANQFGAALARGFGLDYLSVQLGTGVASANQITGGTQLEAGRYVGNDVFVVLVFHPTADDRSSNFLGGARVEWALTDDFNVEGFLEDRFLRNGTTGFALPGVLDNNRVWGLFLFRDWGY